ncbi:DNA alkylation repair protein [Arthrobacter sp. CAU 1506]|nr:DNA alkylation repair protein [Arthrobacter sp. CAU 1506]
MGIMNDLLGPSAVAQLRTSLAGAADQPVWPALEEAGGRLEPLALRARAGLLATALMEDLNGGYERAAAVFRSTLADDGFTGWILWPVGEAAVTLALQDGSQRAFDDALALLAELTPRMSSEFAIRRLLIQDLDRALDAIRGWTAHPDEHVRRLASEGTRPYLPWAVRVPGIVARPAATLPILDDLYLDESETVRRSVANHLNDLSRHDAAETVATAERWRKASGDRAAWVTRHGLRTLVKKADPDALATLGFSSGAVAVSAPQLDHSVVRLPGELGFAVELRNDAAEPARVALDYVVHYVKANGSLAPKVFKLAVADLAPGEVRRFRKKHGFRQMTTRVHYAGRHSVQVQANGTLSPHAGFDVLL